MEYLKRFLWIAFLSVSCALSASAQARPVSFFKKLSAQISGSSVLRENPGMNRLRWMRFYFPTMSVSERNGFWEQVYKSLSQADRQRALAVYLYQMYISSAAYGGEIPSQLTVNYLGVLNSLERLEVSFDLRKSLSFYEKNKKEIKQWLARFFKEAQLPAYQPENPQNDVWERAFLKTLQNSVMIAGRVGYVLDSPRWQATLSEQDKIWLLRIQQQVKENAREKVVLYEEVFLQSGMLDKASGHFSRRVKKYLYRPAYQECAACSYLTCTQVCKQLQRTSLKDWGNMQLYQLQMYPKAGGVLKSENGAYFSAPGGRIYPEWRYHEAVLVILNHHGRYIPVVLDKFLSAEPIAFSEWLTKFNQQETLLYAYPFKRWSDTEERLVRPDQTENGRIVKNGRFYDPYPVN